MLTRLDARRWLGLFAAAFLLTVVAGVALWRRDRPSEVSTHQIAIERIEDQDTSVPDKRSLIAQMARDPSAESTAVLIVASRDPEPDVALPAVRHLTKRVDDRVAQQLIALLESPEFEVRSAAARGLMKGEREDALPALQARLSREDHPKVIGPLRQAIRRLGKSGGGVAGPPIPEAEQPLSVM